MQNTAKGVLGGGALLGGTSLGVDYLRETGFGETAGEVAGITHGIVEATHNIVQKGTDLVENVPFIGDAAPFAFPVVAGAKGGHILADKLFDKERKILRGLTTVAGGTLGGLAATTVAGPYLTVAGLGYTLWKSPKAIEWLARKGVAFPVQSVKWLGDGIKRGKNAAFSKNWSNQEGGVFS